MRFDIVTIFPKFFENFLQEAILSRAIKRGLIKVDIHNLREWTTDRHQTVDDKPFGGGVGMVLKLEPIYKAVKKIKAKGKNKKTKVVLFSPRGKKFDQNIAKKFAKLGRLILICGRYEGVDERVAEYIADEVISIGDYVLSGGEVPAMAVIEAVSRLIPGVVGKKESAEKFDHAQYTRPEVFSAKGGSASGGEKKIKWSAPKVLLSGDHKKIAAWRKDHSRRA